MGLNSALSAVVSGLRSAQESVDLVSRNVSNAGRPGYTRKVQTTSVFVPPASIIVNVFKSSFKLDNKAKKKRDSFHHPS